ncbi:RNA methyltransferase [Candidatus Synechococcus calcipolaris G9]|uniref:tRNA (cytidine/uridine-2'-O-)-methyltransferase TrmJ n=1 Tax=Candidatus Synechococcus calcipolaris G9 TaxID=1497997 RepID=A0ABT6EWN4_9SYNE|nr:RNA methyltransferase [Candidatus Synechococcus calcipolaris]MDG2990180.1 RNA methyltransferase [Candidatus Synechococcus calcipolaris G9]
MADSRLSAVRIVLVEPLGPINVGGVARVMKNMGLSHLVLVDPRCDPQGEEARRWAVHGQDILGQGQVVATLPQALEGCERILATVGRGVADVALPQYSPRQGLPQLITGRATALIFGREDRGLTNQELGYAHGLVAIPAHEDYPSLNLAQAVGVCCYELRQCLGQSTSTVEASTGVTFEALEGFYDHLENLLLAVGFLYPHTAPSRMAKVRSLLARAEMSPAELALLRGMVHQIEWALRSQSS